MRHSFQGSFGQPHTLKKKGFKMADVTMSGSVVYEVGSFAHLVTRCPATGRTVSAWFHHALTDEGEAVLVVASGWSKATGGTSTGAVRRVISLEEAEARLARA